MLPYWIPEFSELPEGLYSKKISFLIREPQDSISK